MKSFSGIAPITNSTWQALVDTNKQAVAVGWAEKGVFATGIGPEYQPGGVLYVGKSAGPLGSAVGSNYDQALSSEASTNWMVQKRNKSAFWQMIDKVDPTRRTIAWTNICKMDELGGQRPPSKNWRAISKPHMDAFAEEVNALRPGVILFATSSYCGSDVKSMLKTRGFRSMGIDLQDGVTRVSQASDGQVAIETHHPQGWPNIHRDRVVELVNQFLSSRQKAA